MKNKLFVLLLILVSTCSVNAQIDKGTRSVSGSFNLNGTKNKLPETNSFGGNIRVGYSRGIAKNWMIGVSPSYDYSSNHSSYYDANTPFTKVKINRQSIGVGVNAVKFFEVKPKLFFFVNQSLSYSFQHIKNTSTVTSSNQISVSNSNSSSVGYYVSPGIMYFLSKHWALSTQIGNAGAAVNFNNGNTSWDLNFSNLFHLQNLQVGVSYFWNKGQGKKD